MGAYFTLAVLLYFTNDECPHLIPLPMQQRDHRSVRTQDHLGGTGWGTGCLALKGSHGFVLQRNISRPRTFSGTHRTGLTRLHPHERMQSLHRLFKWHPRTQAHQTFIQMGGVLTRQQPQFLVQREKNLPRRQGSAHIAV